MVVQTISIRGRHTRMCSPSTRTTKRVYAVLVELAQFWF